MDENNRNFIMAIVLSIAVLVGWQVLYNGPKVAEQEALKQSMAEQKSTAKSAQQPPSSVPQQSANGAPPQPSADGLSYSRRESAYEDLPQPTGLLTDRIDRRTPPPAPPHETQP